MASVCCEGASGFADGLDTERVRAAAGGFPRMLSAAVGCTLWPDLFLDVGHDLVPRKLLYFCFLKHLVHLKFVRLLHVH